MLMHVLLHRGEMHTAGLVFCRSFIPGASMTHLLSETYTAAFDVRAKPRTSLQLEGARPDPEARELDWRVAASQALLEAAPDCVVIFDRDLRVVHFAAGRFQ